MSNSQPRSRLGRALMVFASTIVILAGLKAAADIIVPFLLAAFIALLCTTPLLWLNRRGIPNTLSVIIVLVGLLGISIVLGITVGSSLKKFTKALPTYRTSLQKQTEGLVAYLSEKGLNVDEYRESVTETIDPSSAMGMAGTTLKKASGVLTNGFLILLTVVFILLEAVSMPKKLNRVLKHPEKTLAGFDTFVHSVKHYLFIKTIVSAITGLLAGIATAVIGIDFPILWGVLAFALNFVPNIGSFIAAFPPLLLGTVQHGPKAIVSVSICYIAINVIMGNIIEPRLTGQGLGLSTLVVFLSLIFWGWLLGPVGMLLSVPLTMIVKIACESNEKTQAIGILLGSASGTRAL